MNTAEERNLARVAEAKLDWTKAAELWQIAVDNYPAHNGSQLAIADNLKETGPSFGAFLFGPEPWCIAS
jgi:hypothetical protein